jgi:hypothetical protein
VSSACAQEYNRPSAQDRQLAEQEEELRRLRQQVENANSIRRCFIIGKLVTCFVQVDEIQQVADYRQGSMRGPSCKDA